eukprot:CAMPEP_0206594780 /NCGR_PEP_ID=MMETSP0325_2-20121206/42611_1 /ASSEMBLY_ACC=CAM_ASM_000347 /TAXON_ID=2866 /ORGANISM="Crypthecodinium cohnii, Strain Seligo" /LENGTH=548 /DNA_ID=CAMNT_0054105373 /DNA_START=113 /DNA_END=1759 /DNA_ORIENTATION=+
MEDHFGVQFRSQPNHLKTWPGALAYLEDLKLRLGTLDLSLRVESHGSSATSGAPPYSATANIGPSDGSSSSSTSSSQVPSLWATSIAISALGRGSRWAAALSLLEATRRLALVPDAMLCTSLIAACRPSSAWWQSLALLASMQNQTDGQWARPSVVHYSAAMSACEVGGHWKVALSLLASLGENALSPNVKCYGAAISSCEKAKRLDRANMLLNDMEKIAVMPDEVIFNAIITANGRSHFLEEALAVWRNMLRDQVPPTIMTCASLVSACERKRSWEKALEFLGMADKHRLRLDSVTLNAAISAAESGSQWRHAQILLHSAGIPDASSTSSSSTATTQGFNSCISACAKASEWARAVELVEVLISSGLPCTPVCFNSIMLQLGGREWEVAIQLVERHINIGLRPELAGLRAVASVCQDGLAAAALMKVLKKTAAKLRLHQLEDSADATADEVLEASQAETSLDQLGLLPEAATRASQRGLQRPLARALFVVGSNACKAAHSDRRAIARGRLQDPLLEMGSVLPLDFVRKVLRELALDGPRPPLNVEFD